ncbi:MAG: Mur ligase family protein [Campylobacteraceae bacterium]
MLIFHIITYILLVLALSYYVMSAMQWYSYRINRVIFHFNNPKWHFIYFVLPILLYYLFVLVFNLSTIFYIYFFAVHLPLLYFWYKKLDKPLVFTSRVKRFFIFLFVILAFEIGICVAFKIFSFVLLIPIILAFILSAFYEKIIFDSYKNSAKKKLANMSELTIIAITASYGKTSIKNFLFHILSIRFNCYKTPRSVNTLAGLVLDVNRDLPNDTKFYIAEAGAREKGDIKEITDFLSPKIAIVGQIGAQHIEYFKTLENIRNTKMELISSENLQKAFIHVSANINIGNNQKIELFGDDLTIVSDSLDGLLFEVIIDGKKEEFKTSLLGSFNATNLAVCIKVAHYLGMDIETIRKAILSLKSVEHRLERLDVQGKIIIDDSFNGNFEGMKSSYLLAKTHNGRKVLVTPGIVESTKEDNEKLAIIMDDVFDLVIITGFTNMEILDNTIKKAKKILLKDKSKLTDVLANETHAGDLILFSNDAPTYM